MRPVIYTDEFILKVLEYHKTHTQAETMRHFHISKTAVINWRNEHPDIIFFKEPIKYPKGSDEYKKRHYERGMKWIKNNPERRKKITKTYRAKHPLRMLVEYSNRRFDNTSSDFYKLKPFDLWKILKTQKMICPLTGYKLSTKNISVDHIIPVSKGGTNQPSNIRIVDVIANKMLFTSTDEEFFKICKDICNYQLQINNKS